MISPHVNITGEATVKKLAGTDVMPAFRKRMRAASRDLVPAVKVAILNTPSRRAASKNTGDSLRAAVAASVQRKVKLGKSKVLIVIAMVPKGGKSNLASVLEGTKDWHHPVYGHKPDKHQASHSYFFHTIDALSAGVGTQIDSVLNDFEREI